MTTPEPTIRVKVDPYNPGQFFACCGLLELADRLWPGAEGWFADGQFRFACGGTLATILQTLVELTVEAPTKLSNGLTVKPIIAPLVLTHTDYPAFNLTLDSWMAIKVAKNKVEVIGNRPWNFWSGNQKSFGIWSDLRLAFAEQLPGLKEPEAERLLSLRVPLTGRFGFDSGAAWNALDVGFSPNTQQMPVASSPGTEMLAAIGIQRFRPLLSNDRRSFLYSTWGQPLLPSVAAAAASSLVCVAPATHFRGQVIDRGQYAALGYSTLLKGALHD